MTTDNLLTELVRRADTAKLSTAVMVQIDGALVLGKLTSQGEFAAALGLPQESGGSDSHFVHLKDVKIHHDGQITPIAWWRGNMDKVSSFGLADRVEGLGSMRH